MKASLGVGDPPTRPNPNGGVNQIRFNMIRSRSATRASWRQFPALAREIGSSCRSTIERRLDYFTCACNGRARVPAASCLALHPASGIVASRALGGRICAGNPVNAFAGRADASPFRLRKAHEE
jgi:hypothetical protein